MSIQSIVDGLAAGMVQSYFDATEGRYDSPIPVSLDEYKSRESEVIVTLRTKGDQWQIEALDILHRIGHGLEEMTDLHLTWMIGIAFDSSHRKQEALQDLKTRALSVTELAKTFSTYFEPLLPHGSDGPIPPNAFRWQGTVFEKCPPTSWKLLNYCWDSPNHCGGFDGMAEAVWGDSEYVFAGDPIRQAATKLTKFFKDHGIPLRCALSEKTKTATICQVSTEDTP